MGGNPEKGVQKGNFIIKFGGRNVKYLSKLHKTVEPGERIIGQGVTGLFPMVSRIFLSLDDSSRSES